MLDEGDLAKLEARCRTVRLAENEYVATDFVTALLGTMMNYQNSTTTVERAGRFFESNAWYEVRTLDDLEAVLERFTADRDGNDALGCSSLAGDSDLGLAVGVASTFAPRGVEGHPNGEASPGVHVMSCWNRPG